MEPEGEKLRIPVPVRPRAPRPRPNPRYEHFYQHYQYQQQFNHYQNEYENQSWYYGNGYMNPNPNSMQMHYGYGHPHYYGHQYQQRQHYYSNSNHNTFHDPQFAHFGQERRAPKREWENTPLGQVVANSGHRDHRSVLGDGLRFTLLSYNVLSPKLLSAHPYLYRECDPSHLSWEARKAQFQSEVQEFDPDIVCLQEIESSILHEYNDFFFGQGFQGVYKKRTGDKTDGCAIYYRESKFRFVDCIAIEYFQKDVNLLNRDNVGILLKLETKKEVGVQRKRQKLVVATTHLLFNPKREDVKMAQVQMLLAELDRLAFCGFEDGEPLYLPSIVTGDFNVTPYTPLSLLMQKGKLTVVDANGNTARSLSRNNSPKFIPPKLGISDQCQHYKVVHQRLRLKKMKKAKNFEMGSMETHSFLGLPSTLNLTVGSEVISRTNSVTSVQSVYSNHSTTIKTATATASATTEQLRRPAEEEPASGASSQSSLVIATSATYFQQTEGQRLSSKIYEVPPEVEEGIVEEILKTGTLCTFGSGEFSHRFGFIDVYGSKLSSESDAGVATTKQKGWVCVDYIYYSTKWNNREQQIVEGNLKLIRRLGLLTRNQCKQLGNIPLADVSSDHFPLLADFVIH